MAGKQVNMFLYGSILVLWLLHASAAPPGGSTNSPTTTISSTTSPATKSNNSAGGPASATPATDDSSPGVNTTITAVTTTTVAPSKESITNATQASTDANLPTSGDNSKSTTAASTTAVPTTAVPTTAVPPSAVPTSSNVSVPATTGSTTAATTTAVPTTAATTTAVPTTAVPTSSNVSFSATTTPATAASTSSNASTTAALTTTAAPPTAVPTTTVPTTTVPITAAPTSSNASVSETTVPTTAAPTSPTVSVSAPTSTTSEPTTQNTTITTAGGTTPEVNPSSTVPSTASPQPGPQQVIYINEVLVDKDGSIQKIELHLSDNFNVTKYAMLMVDGSNNKYTSLTYLKDVIKGDNNLMIVSFSDKVPTMKKKGVGIAIYNTDQIVGGLTDDWTATNDGLVDALVIGMTYEATSESLIQVLTPGAYPFIINPSLYGQRKSISRCSSNLVCDSSMFALINPSMGLFNERRCKERLSYQRTFSLKLLADCDVMRLPNKTDDTEKMKLLMRHVLHEVNRKCQCGITEMHVSGLPLIQCCGDLSLNMKFVAPNEEQEETFQDSYKAFLQSTQSVMVDQNNYTIDPGCYSYCCAQPAPSANSDKSSDQVKVTVAVVVSCLIVFMIIVIVLVMYMRRKKSAVYQFRMSRLAEEEDDMNVDGADCDDFVGGQEATFDLKR